MGTLLTARLSTLGLAGEIGEVGHESMTAGTGTVKGGRDGEVDAVRDGVRRRGACTVCASFRVLLLLPPLPAKEVRWLPLFVLLDLRASVWRRSGSGADPCFSRSKPLALEARFIAAPFKLADEAVRSFPQYSI